MTNLSEIWINKQIQTVKALYFKEHGGLDMIQYGEVPDTTPGLS